MELSNGILQQVIQEIDAYPIPLTKRADQQHFFELKAHEYLVTNLSGWVGALCIRAILHRLQVDEHRIFNWRLDNKLIQHLVLEHYVPGCMPDTLSFLQTLSAKDGYQKIKALFTQGYFIKATLGAGSFRTNDWDKTKLYDEIVQTNTYTANGYELWMLQEKLVLDYEFRVHTFDRNLIPGLTINTKGEFSESFEEAEQFTTLVLRQLPNAILHQTLLAWDIGLTANGKYYVIEINLTGYHPVYLAGFQTTGFVDNDLSGPIVCAWFNIYFKTNYGTAINSVHPSLLIEFPYLEAFIYYSSLFRAQHIKSLAKRSKDNTLAIIIYLGAELSYYLARLIHFFKQAKFADRYYLITTNEYFLEATAQFKTDDQVHILKESELFDQEQYHRLKLLGEDDTEEMCMHYALKIGENKTCILI